MSPIVGGIVIGVCLGAMLVGVIFAALAARRAVAEQMSSDEHSDG